MLGVAFTSHLMSKGRKDTFIIVLYCVFEHMFFAAKQYQILIKT